MPRVPARYFYAPADQRRDIIEGWWVVRKYNCMGCHQVHVGQTTVFMTLPRYQDPDWKDQRPPTLIGEGARVNPEWLMGFLNNPSLDRKSVRTWTATACAAICRRACRLSISPTAKSRNWCASSRRCHRRRSLTSRTSWSR